MNIPKIIHYCWFGPNPLGKLHKKCIKSWNKHLFDFEIKLWNEQNSPMDHPFVKAAYEAEKYAFVADYVRLWALYREGGIYLDTDMLLLKSLNVFLPNNVFLGYEAKNKISAGIIGSIPNSLFIRNSLMFYDNLLFDESNLASISIPGNLSKVCEQLPASEVPRIFPVDYFYSLPFESTIHGNFSFKKYLTENSYAVHLWDASWLEELNDYRNSNQGIRGLFNYFYSIIKRIRNVG